MTAELVNLRQARKAKARTAAERGAETNRAVHGRTKAGKRRTQAEAERQDRLLDGFKRDPH